MLGVIVAAAMAQQVSQTCAWEMGQWVCREPSHPAEQASPWDAARQAQAAMPRRRESAYYAPPPQQPVTPSTDALVVQTRALELVRTGDCMAVLAFTAVHALENGEALMSLCETVRAAQEARGE